MKTEVIIMDKEYKERMVEKGERHERVPRRVYLQKDDFERWGYTSGAQDVSRYSRARRGRCIQKLAGHGWRRRWLARGR